MNALCIVEDENLEQEREKTIRGVLNYLKESGKSQNELAKAVGLSSGVISGFLSGKYSGNTKKIIQKLSSYLNLSDQRERAIKKPGFVETSVSSDILAVLNYARVNQDIGLVYGEAGLGKSVTIKEYIKTNPDVILVTADPSISNPKAICEEILEQMNRREYGNLRSMMKTIVSVLKDSGRMIIIDEAQHLKNKALEVIRSIYDKANIGMVLCGNQEVYSRLHGRGEAVFAQFFSRVGIRRNLSAVKPEDVTKILERNGYYLPKDCLEYMKKVSQSRGGLRYVIKMFILAQTMAQGAGVDFSLDVLLQAKNMLMLE